jgi:ferredoxin-NADP reductase
LSSTHFHDRISEGDILQVKAPSGHFHIDSTSQTPVVLIAGGIGITPMISMLRWCLDEQPGRTIHLYYGLRHGHEQAFKHLLEQLAPSTPNFKLHVTYSRPGENDVQGRDFQHTGHVNVELLKQTLPHGQHQFYVCGPPAMMESLIPALINWGVARNDLHYEAFGPASIKLPGDPVPPAGPDTDTAFAIQFSRSGRTLEWTDQDDNLLEFAERHGVVVDSGCRAGSCGSCETGLLHGEVTYNQTPDHDITPGHCLLCVGKPASALTLDV